MSPAGRRRRRGGGGGRRVDLWRPVPELPEPEPVRPADDPRTVLLSLGSAPLPGQGQVAGHYFAEVAKEAARLATLLAFSGGLLAEPEPDQD